MVLIAGPWVSSAIRNQFNTVAGTLGNGIDKGSWETGSTGGGNGSLTDADIVDPVHGTAFAVYSEDDHSLMFYKRRGVPKVGGMFNYRRVTDVYTGFETGTYRLVETPTNRYGSSTAPWAAHQSQIEAVKIIDDGIAPKSVSVWFSNMTKLKSVDVARLDTSKCTQMADTFFMATQLQSLDLSSWDVSSSCNFSCMFQECHSLKNLDIRGWSAYPEKAGLFGMFFNCPSLQSLDLSGFDLASAVNDNKMFGHCQSLSRITLGSSWKWVICDDGEGTNSYLPTPSADINSGADGKWYSASTGKGYAPQNIPNNTADTYVASRDMLAR